MGSDYKTLTIGETCHVTDGAHSKVKRQESGVLYLTSKNIKVGTLSLGNVDYISEADYEKLFSIESKAQRRPQDGDVLIGIIGTFGNAYRYKKDDVFGISSSIAIIRPDAEILDSDFLYYVVTGDVFKAIHSAYKSGSVQGYTNIPTIKELPLLIPPLPEQKAIAHILGSLDDKIELNRQMNETLEAMAQALFTSWFVNFDPVIDNALAAGNPIPDELLERAEQRQTMQHSDNDNQAIRALFPAEFEFTEEMGWIPKGWAVTPVYEVADFINGSSFKSQYFSDESEGLPIIKIAEIKNGISQQTKFTTQEMPKKYFINDGSILFSWSGNPDTSIDTFIWTGGDGWLNQHIFNVVLYRNSDKTFVYYLLKSLKPVFTEIARDKQTTGLGHLTIKDMKRTYTIKPSTLALEAFGLHSNSIFERWYQNLFSSRELAKLRDTLLPKLLSGELRIPDVAAMVEDA